MTDYPELIDFAYESSKKKMKEGSYQNSAILLAAMKIMFRIVVQLLLDIKANTERLEVKP